MVTKQKLAQDEVAERVKKAKTRMSRPEFEKAYSMFQWRKRYLTNG